MRCNNCGWENPAEVKRCEKCNQLLPEISEMPAVAPAESTPAPADSAPAAADNNEVLNCPKCGYILVGGTSYCPNCGWEEQSNNNPIEPAPQSAPSQANSMMRTVMMGSKQSEAPAPSPADTKKTVVVSAMPEVEPMPTVSDTKKTVVMATTPEVEPMPTVSDTKRTVILGAIPEVEPTKSSRETKSTVRELPNDLIVEQPQATAESAQHTLTPVDGFSGNALAVALNGNSITLNRENVEPANMSIAEGAQAEVVCENGEWYIRNLSELKNTYICVERKTKLEKGDIIVIGNRRYIFS